MVQSKGPLLVRLAMYITCRLHGVQLAHGMIREHDLHACNVKVAQGLLAMGKGGGLGVLTFRAAGLCIKCKAIQFGHGLYMVFQGMATWGYRVTAQGWNSDIKFIARLQWSRKMPRKALTLTTQRLSYLHHILQAFWNPSLFQHYMFPDCSKCMCPGE